MKKIICAILICFSVISCFGINFENKVNAETTEYAGMIGEILNQGNGSGGFKKPEGANDAFATSIDDIAKDIKETIALVGNVIIFACGALLGTKYVWSAASDKADAKGGLVPYTIGVAFFYCAQAIYDFVYGVISTSVSGSDINIMSGNVYQNIILIVTLCCVVAIAVIGLKYMFSNADIKADLKKRLIPMVLGIILIFSTSQIIGIIIKFTNDTLRPAPLESEEASINITEMLQ